MQSLLFLQFAIFVEPGSYCNREDKYLKFQLGWGLLWPVQACLAAAVVAGLPHERFCSVNLLEMGEDRRLRDME